MKKKSKYLIVISVDALSEIDFESIKQMKNFGELIRKGAYSKEVRGIYPTLTYPSHVSIITGNYPNKHKVWSNEKNEPERQKQNWNWHYDNIKSKTKIGRLGFPLEDFYETYKNLSKKWSKR